jgi:hypothetical protein
MKLVLYKDLTWEYVAEAHPSKLLCLQNRKLWAAGNLDRCALIHELHMALNIPYMYD